MTESPERVGDVDDVGTRELIFTLGNARLLISCSDLASYSVFSAKRPQTLPEYFQLMLQN